MATAIKAEPTAYFILLSPCEVFKKGRSRWCMKSTHQRYEFARMVAGNADFAVTQLRYVAVKCQRYTQLLTLLAAWLKERFIASLQLHYAVRPKLFAKGPKTLEAINQPKFWRIPR
jgi:hypothetical protein